MDAPASGAQPPPPARPARPRLRRVLLGALAVVLVYVAFALATDVRAFVATVSRLRPAALVLALALIVAVYVVRSLRWRLYLGRLGAVPDAGDLAFLPAFAMGLPQGKWGQVVKAWALRTRSRLSYERAVPAIVAERVSDVAGGLLHLVVGLAIVRTAGPRATLIALAALLALYAGLRSRLVARALVRWLGWSRWVRTHAIAILAGHEGLRGHTTPRALLPPALMALAAFLLESLALWALATPGLGLDLSIPKAILIVALMDIAATVTFLPGGIVAAEGSLIILLVLEGIPLPEATALTLLFRIVALWWGIGLGVLGTAYLWAQRRDNGRMRGAAAE